MKRFKKISKVLIAVSLITVSAFALLKTGVLGKEKNTLIIDPNARYDIVADLDGGKFEPGSKPEFIKMDNGKWLYKYKPSMLPTKLPKPVKEGFEFTGWVVDNSETPKPEYSIPVWNKKNINLRAEWRVLEKYSVLIDGPTFNKKIASMPEIGNITEVKFLKGEPKVDGINVASIGEITAHIDGNILYVVSNDSIYLNSNSSKMFYSLDDNYDTVFSIESFDFSNFNTSLVTDMSMMFGGCSSLAEIDLHSFDTSHVTNMNGMFANCMSLTSLDLHNFDTSNVTDMMTMFGACIKLDHIIGLDNFNTSKVTTMAGMFTSCYALTEVNVSSFDTAKVSDMESMFASCMGLTRINGIDKFNTSNVTKMNSMFIACSVLDNLDVSSFDVSKVVDFNYMFYSCKALTNFKPFRLHTNANSSLVGMFYNCDNLTCDLTVIGTEAADYTQMFNGCAKAEGAKVLVKYISLESKKFARELVRTKSEGNNVFLWDPKSSLITGGEFNSIMKQHPEVEKIIFNCEDNDPNGIDFSRDKNKAITGVITGDTLTISYLGHIKANEDCSNMFANLDINKVTFDNFETDEVINMSSMFSGCTKLNQIDFSGWKVFKVTDMSSMFRNCNSLKSIINFEKLNIGNVRDFSYTFRNCNNLSGSISIINDTPKTYTEMFKGCSSSLSAEFWVKYGSTASRVVASSMVSTKNEGDHVYMQEIVSTLINGTSFYNKIIKIPGYSNIKTIKFVQDIPIQDGVDVAAEGEAIAYVDGTELRIVSGGKLCANQDSSLMFYWARRVTGIDFGNLDTSKVVNATRMFGSIGATSLDLTGLDFSSVTDASWMFSSCSYLESIKGLGKFTSLVDAYMMFEDCRSLVNLDVSRFGSSKVEDMRRMFAGCESLQHINGINDWGAKNVSDLYRAFYNCTSLVDIDLSNFNISNLTKLEEVFRNCSSLERIYGISDWNTSNVTSATMMFYSCSKLTDLDLSRWDLTSLGSADSMFRDCTNLSGEIYLDGREIFTHHSMFTGCSTNPSSKFIIKYNEEDFLLIPERIKAYLKTKSSNSNVVTPQKTVLRQDFGEKFVRSSYISGVSEIRFVKGKPEPGDYNLACQGVAAVSREGSILYIKAEDTIYTHFNAKNMFGFSKIAPFNANSSIKKIVFDNINTSYTINMNSMFDGCSGLTELDLSMFDTSKVTDMSSMFKDCRALQNLNLSKFDTNEVVNMNSMFYHCESLPVLDVSTFDTLGVTDMGWMFYKCSSLQDLDVTNFDISSAISVQCMFRDCQSLTTLDLTNFDTSLVEFMDGMFTYCYNLQVIKGIEDFSTKNTSNMDSMFASCNSLSVLDVSRWDTSNVTNMSYMFSGVPVTELDISNFSTSEVTDMSGMFNYCSNLLDLDMSNFDTSKVTNMSYMFKHCSSLTNLNLDNFNTFNVTTMEGMFDNTRFISLNLSGLDTKNVTSMSSMFAGCTELVNLNLNGWDTSSLVNISTMFYDCHRIKSSIPIMSSKLNEYRASFSGCATYPGSELIINYTKNTASIVDTILEKVLPGSNVKLGEEVEIIQSAKRDTQPGQSSRDTVKNGKTTVEPNGTGDIEQPNESQTIQPVKNSDSSVTQPTTPKPVKLTLINGPSAQYPKQVIQITNNKIPNLNAPDLNPLYAGQFGGYYYDEQFTKPVKQGDIITRDLIVYARW